MPTDEQLRHKLLSRYRGNGLLGGTGEYTLWMGTGKAPERQQVLRELIEAGAITPLAVEGFRTPRFAVSAELPILDAAEVEVAADGDALGRPNGQEPGVAFIAPLDPLAWDRDLLLRLFDFDYRWEVYVPADKAALGLLRAAAAVRRPLRGSHRAPDGPPGGHAAGARAVVAVGLRSAR